MRGTGKNLPAAPAATVAGYRAALKENVSLSVYLDLDTSVTDDANAAVLEPDNAAI